MTKTEKNHQTKSKLPILVGAISGPLLINAALLLIDDLGPPSVQNFAFYILAPAIIGALVGTIARRIAKSLWGAIILTLIGNALFGVACLASIVLLVLFIATQSP